MNRVAVAKELMKVAKSLVSFGVSREVSDTFLKGAQSFVKDAKLRGLNADKAAKVIPGVRFSIWPGERYQTDTDVTITVFGRSDDDWFVMARGTVDGKQVREEQDGASRVPDENDVATAIRQVGKKIGLWTR